VDLSSYEDVKASSAEILEVISLPVEDPGSMPVTRDLSAYHRKMIQAWIARGCPA
jgi:hypothetical protein